MQHEITIPQGHAEMAVASSVAASQALTVAQYTAAMAHPRNILDVEQRLLKACRRPRFADAARFAIPFAGGAPATGWTIRFAEACLRELGNLSVDAPIVHEDEDRQVVSVTVIDLERNIAMGSNVVVEKVVERRTLRKGQLPVGQRQNSYGDTVYLVPATEQEMRAKRGAEVSKTLRTNVLRLVPADILEACEDEVAATLARDDAASPDEATKRLVGHFTRIGVKAADVEALLGHTLDGVVAGELDRLRGYYGAMINGLATWRQIVELESRDGPPDSGDDPLAEVQRSVQDAIARAGGKHRRKANTEPTP